MRAYFFDKNENLLYNLYIKRKEKKKLFWLIVGIVVGFFGGVWGTLKFIEDVYPEIYKELENGTAKVKYYNSKAKEAENEKD